MIGSWISAAVSAILFLFFQAQGIYTGDSGDLVTAAAVGGVPHPPGYPLYSWFGWLLSHIPISTVSWRLTLLSSVPHAITVGLVYALIYRMTKKNVIASIFGAVSLSANYLFFLYSVTPEVFALFDLFVVLLWFLLFTWQESKNVRFLYAAFFVFGLSLSHHHVMLFFVPAILYFLWANSRILLPVMKRPVSIARGIGLTALGFLPYLYIPFAAAGDPIINWDRVVNTGAFWRLISRADYGTFVSGGSFGQTLGERWLSVVAYGQFLVTDWSLIGILLAGVGLFSWWRPMRIRFWSWGIALLCIGPLFLFYASFPLASRFTLGTYERFLLPEYTMLSVLIGAGLAACMEYANYALRPYADTKKRTIVVVLLGIIFMIYPLSLGGITLWRFWGMPQDRSAENLGRDILANTPQHAVLLLSQDTSLFTTQYVRYVLGERPDTAVIHAARLSLPDYQIVLKKHFPRLQFPSVPQTEFLSAFVKENSTSETRVFSNISLPIGDRWYWVPRGLLYEAIPSEALPSVSDMYGRASAIRARMHDPRAGILSRYPHLMLSDVLDVYASGHIALGKTLVRADKWEEARQEFARAAALEGDTSVVEALELLGLTQVYMKDCSGALASFEQAKRKSFVASPSHLRLESVTYGECLGDAVRARELFSEYERLKKASEQPLEAL